tara:strand:+ start:2959 stop:4155 length:1197 start_codon:yes stop_codon:yes gene_type:complete
MHCKITNNKIKPFMTFGRMPIANGFINKKDFKKEYFYEMSVGFSKKISLVQLINHPKPKQMFNNNYPFFTGSSKGMILHFKKYASWIKKRYMSEYSKLIEIGSNDGTFLTNFKNTKNEVLGIEPSLNVAKISKKKGIKTLNKFFNYKNVKRLKRLKSKVDVICGANVICHIPDLKSLIKGIDFLLSKKGVFIFEEPYLGSMYKKTSYDQIYDEHIYIFSVSSVKKIFSIYGFDLIDVLPQNTHGGSMRYIVSRKNQNKVSKRVSHQLKKEKLNNIDTIKGCLSFKKKCELSKKNLLKKLNLFKSQGKTIAGYAATSKSTTVLNYCKIGTEFIDFISDTTKDKIGKYSPGTHIPIKSMNFFYNNIPDVAYLFAWNHREEIFKKEKRLKNSIQWISHVKI